MANHGEPPVFHSFFKSARRLSIMSKIFGSILEAIGGTPLVEVKGFDEGGARVLAKVEYFNPGGSVKDRIALSMIDDAEKRGLLLPGGTIIEPTSGKRSSDCPASRMQRRTRS